MNDITHDPNKFLTAEGAWLKTIKDILSEGKPVEPQKTIGANGQPSYEIRNHQLVFDLQQPVITIKPNTSWLYMASEAMWVIDGSNKLDYSPEIARIQEPYSDSISGKLYGAYGPPFKAQSDYVINTLNKDQNSRQAILDIWRKNPRPSKDIPCTVSMQFLIRDNFINSHVYMRSSDVGKGLPYDMFTFACITAEIASRLDTDAELGSCCITAGSRHIYLNQMDPMTRVIDDGYLKMWQCSPWKRWKWPAIKEALRSIVIMDKASINREEAQVKAKQIIMEASGGTTNS